MTQAQEFKVGDRVVYPAHGVGEIIDQESQIIGGMQISVFVISFSKEKMTLRIPVARAAAVRLRHLSSREEFNKALDILRGKAKSSKGMWSRRAQEYETKINSGDLLAICEVVRDLYKNVEDPDRSYSERVIYESALNRLVGEFAAIENVDVKDAMDSILDHIREKEAA
jgi:CarD family transcriptional regulator